MEKFIFSSLEHDRVRYQRSLDAYASENPDVKFERLPEGSQHYSYHNGTDPEDLKLGSVHEWKEIIYNQKDRFIEISVRRSNIVQDAVKAYKELHSTPGTIPRHLMLRRLVVRFENEPGNQMREFLVLFTAEIIEKYKLFSYNPQGFLVLNSEEVDLTEDVLDMYEAFGFFSAKAFQIDLSIGKCNSYPLIFIKMLKQGHLKNLKVGDFDSYDKKFIAHLRSSTPEAQLHDKIKNHYRTKMQVQLIMITLGFVRACPGGLIARDLFNSSFANLF